MKLFLPILLLLMPGCTTSIVVEKDPSVTDSKTVSLSPSLPKIIPPPALGPPAPSSIMVPFYPRGGGGGNRKVKKDVCGNGQYDSLEQCDDGSISGHASRHQLRQ